MCASNLSADSISVNALAPREFGGVGGVHHSMRRRDGLWTAVCSTAPVSLGANHCSRGCCHAAEQGLLHDFKATGGHLCAHGRTAGHIRGHGTNESIGIQDCRQARHTGGKGSQAHLWFGSNTTCGADGSAHAGSQLQAQSKAGWCPRDGCSAQPSPAEAGGPRVGVGEAEEAQVYPWLAAGRWPWLSTTPATADRPELSSCPPHILHNGW